MLKKKTVLLVLVALIFTISPVMAKKGIKYKTIKLKNVSRYSEDRMAFQRIERTDYDARVDNSLECLLIIKNRKMYLIKDGSDNAKLVEMNRIILETENRLIPDLWKNKVNNKPDYIKVTDRRIEILKKADETFVDKNFGDFYRKARNRLIQTHVDIFTNMMINRKESGLYVEKKPIPKRLKDTGPTKYSTVVKGKMSGGTIYYAADADGDGITETFTVRLADGFNWGYKSGPNILFIYNNNKSVKKDSNNAEIEKIIGKLAHDAYYGTPREEKIIQETFPKTAEINDMMDDIYRVVKP